MIYMSVFSPVLDIVAGVSILVGKTTALDKPLLTVKGLSLTYRQILGLGFAGVGLGNLWTIRQAQKGGEEDA
tara:strand:- start:329 stop:544 length:216 start_codon:yes stop_codon:yes gene_type:complete